MDNGLESHSLDNHRETGTKIRSVKPMLGDIGV